MSSSYDTSIIFSAREISNALIPELDRDFLSAVYNKSLNQMADVNTISKYISFGVHWSTLGIPLYSCSLADSLTTLGIEKAAQAVFHRGSSIRMYPMRAANNSVAASITYWGAVGGSCQDPALAYGLVPTCWAMPPTWVFRNLDVVMGLENRIVYNLVDVLTGKCRVKQAVIRDRSNLDKVAEYVKNGIYAAGGTAVEFGTIAACDGVAQGHEGMHYILPSREIICDSVEIMAQAHRLDGLVLLASCDKIVPAMLMAAARLDIPCIVCVGGPMLGGIEFDGRT